MNLNFGYLFEQYWKKLKLEFKRNKVNFLQKYPSVQKNNYPEGLKRITELGIELKGHAWCMDVKSERKKMAKLVFNLLSGIK